MKLYMRKYKMTTSLILFIVAMGYGAISHAQVKTPDSTITQLNKLLASNDALDHATLGKRLATLAASSEEREMAMAVQYYTRLKNNFKSDSVSKAILAKFPAGKMARSQELQKVYNSKTSSAKQDAYKAWNTKFPAEKFKTGDFDDQLIYDYGRADVARQFASEKNSKQAVLWIAMLEVDFWKGNAYYGLSDIFYKNGDLPNAEIFAKKALEIADSYRDGKKGISNQARFAAIGYPGYALHYANILYDQKKNKAALSTFEKAHQAAEEVNAQLNFKYAQLLIGENRTQEAYDKLEEVVKAGKASPEIATQFKSLYTKVKGSDAGYSEYAAAIRKSYLENLNRRLSKEMINEQGGDFALTDLNGKEVALKDLKGKVVILDFWATWCAPCKRSFPAMQMAVNKYKDDPNVRFLFIHTWERTNTAAKDASDYIKSQKYTFDVLMDLKDPETNLNKAVTSYKVQAIPAKFVIDGQGKIRFRLNPGADTSNEAVVDEISMMIDMAKKAS